MQKIKQILMISSIAVALSFFSAPAIHAQSFDSVTHIHSIKVLSKKILIGTHNKGKIKEIRYLLNKKII